MSEKVARITHGQSRRPTRGEGPGQTDGGEHLGAVPGAEQPLAGNGVDDPVQPIWFWLGRLFDHEGVKLASGQAGLDSGRLACSHFATPLSDMSDKPNLGKKREPNLYGRLSFCSTSRADTAPSVWVSTSRARSEGTPRRFQFVIACGDTPKARATAA